MDGHAHAAATWVAALPTAALLTYAAQQAPAWRDDALLLGAGALAAAPLAVAVNPDLDQEGFSRVEWGLIQRFSIFGFLWLIYWYPYAVAFEHRSAPSHLPFLGTALRVAYAGALPALTWAVWQIETGWAIRAGVWLVGYYLLSSPMVYLGMLAGVALAAAWIATWPTWAYTLSLGALGMLVVSDALHALMDLVA